MPKFESSKLFFKGSDVEGLLNVPDIKKFRKKRPDIEVFYATGLRVSELTSLNRDSLVQGRSQLLVPPVSGETSTRFFSRGHLTG